jgi:predicted metalloprotease with PDZ domain
MFLRKLLRKHQPRNPDQQARRTKMRHLGLVHFAFIWALFGVCATHAETLNVKISVISLAPARVKIEGERSNGTRVWSFRRIYGSLINLGERFEKLSLWDSSGASVQVRQLAPGEYDAAREATRFSYEVKLDAPLFDTDASHVSWLAGERGFFMLGDLLPLPDEKSVTSTGATIRFELPGNWKIASGIRAEPGGEFQVPEMEKAVFFAGKDVRERHGRVGAMDFALVTSGEWAFSDEDAASMAASILKDHTETFGGVASSRSMLILAPFPRAVGADHWSAETRGNTVTLLSGKLPSKTAALAQLSFPLAHELFHLWIPNGLALDGNYDWFYEGFTLYQALRAGIRLNLLTFQDYLNTLGRAFDAYQSVSGRDKASLLDASEQRWTVQPSLIYNKGMLVAFLYDLTLRQQTRGKRSLDDVYRELFRLYHAPESRKDGNAAVIAVLNEAGSMQEFTRRYIESASAIEFPAAIASFGLQVEQGGVRTHVSVSSSLSSAQRDLLRKFGYNEKTYGVSGHRGVK